MECPYCHNIMKEGSIDVYDTLSWSPKGESRRGGTKFAKSPHGIILSKFLIIFPASKESYYCYNCKKIIINEVE